MKKLLLLLVAPFVFLSSLSAQITQEEADGIVLNYMSGETRSYTVYAKENIQENMIVTASAEEVIELNYTCWAYYVYFPDISLGYCLIAKASDGNLLKVSTKNNMPNDLSQWRVLMGNYRYKTGYIVGYETCGLTIENEVGHTKGYIFISEDLKDTLAVYNFPQSIYDFPAEIFTETSPYLVNASFPEQYRNTFKVQLGYTLSSEEEVFKLGLKDACAMPAIYPIRETYKQCIPVIIHSAKKIKECDWEEVSPATATDIKAKLNAVFSETNPLVANIPGDTLFYVIHSKEELAKVSMNINTPIDIDFENQTLVWGRILTSSISDNIHSKQLSVCESSSDYKYTVTVGKCIDCWTALGNLYFWDIYPRKIDAKDIAFIVSNCKQLP